MRSLGVLPPTPPSIVLRRARPRAAWPLSEPDCALYSRARHALHEGVKTLGLEAGDEVLFPLYHHGSEVEALIQAGLKLRFYDLDEDLQPRREELETSVGDRTRALYLIHPLGFVQPAASWRRWCDDRGLFLLEDAAQAWLASGPEGPAGSHGHLSIFCLYKSVGIPDGAALHLEAMGSPQPEGTPELGALRLVRRMGAFLASRSSAAEEVIQRLRRVDGAGEDEFSLGRPRTPPLRSSTFALARLPLGEAVEQRREHYRFLLEPLGTLVPRPFRELTEGASPFAFPIEVGRPAEVLAGLRANAVGAFAFWSLIHEAVPTEVGDRILQRRRKTIALPVHQHLEKRDLVWMIETVKSLVA